MVIYMYMRTWALGKGKNTVQPAKLSAASPVVSFSVTFSQSSHLPDTEHCEPRRKKPTIFCGVLDKL